jgi:hypothetical protein
VIDPGLCHGAAGLAHIYNRIYCASGEPLFADAARRWFERTLEMRKPGLGVAGYQSWGPKAGAPRGEMEWLDDGSFLTGAIGIALALLGGIAPLEPNWDRLLLTSVPPAL